MKIAIVKLSALGDIVHAMVVLQFIKKHNPEVIIDWVVDQSCKDLLELHPDINKVHTVDLKKAKKKKSVFILFKELRKISQFGQYDAVIDMQGLIKSAVISHLIFSPITLGFEKSSLRESVSSVFYNQTFKYSYDKNVVERNLALISNFLNFTLSKESIINKEFFLYSRQKYKFKAISNILPNIVLIPGASYDSKVYSYQKFAKIALEIEANFIIVWGSEIEKLLAEKIKILCPKVQVMDKLSIDFLVSLISQVDLVIGSDTGPTHMAWALNIPSITLFGPTPAYRNTYNTNINKAIESDSKVNPLKINKLDYSINNINAYEVIILAQDLLKNKQAN
jgi:heptosyltransferase-1